MDKNILKAGGGPIVPRAGGGPIVVRFSGGDGPEYIGEKRVVGMGWQPDVPDNRDYTLNKTNVEQVLKKVRSGIINLKTKIPKKIDNRSYCSPVENQQSLGSCTANAVIGMMEYMMRRSKIDHVNLSRLFLYKVTRSLLGWTGDTGAYIRSTMKASAVFGIPPEKYFPYQINKFEDEPSAFLYSFAANFKSLNYARLDDYNLGGKETLGNIKRILAAGYVTAFGFPVYNSMTNEADIPYPDDQDNLEGGHAVLAVGYDDGHRNQEGKTVPSLIIRNSWGASWGSEGYGYLPYGYVLDGLAQDFWTIFKEDWINPKIFK